MSGHHNDAAMTLDMIDGSYSWYRLVVSLIIGSFGSVGMWSIVVVLPAVQAEFGVDRGGASIAYTATMIGFGLGNFLLGRAVDKWGITIPLIFAAFALGFGYIGAALVHDIWLFSIFQGALIGLGASASFAPLISDISRWFLKRRGIAVAIVANGNYIGGAIWPHFLETLMAFDNWRLAYIGTGILCFAAMAPMAFLLKQRPPELHIAPGQNASGATRVTDLSPAHLQWLLIIAGIGCCVAMSMPQVHIVALCADLGFGVAAGAGMLSLMLMGGVVSRLISGLLADRFGGVVTLLIGSVLQCIALILYLPFNTLGSLYIVSLIFGLSQGGIVPSYAVIVREYLPAREAGSRIGIVIMATVAGMALGGWLSGWIYDLTGSYQAAFLNGIAWNFLNIGIMVLILLRTRTPAHLRVKPA